MKVNSERGTFTILGLESKWEYTNSTRSSFMSIVKQYSMPSSSNANALEISLGCRVSLSSFTM